MLSILESCERVQSRRLGGLGRETTDQMGFTGGNIIHRKMEIPAQKLLIGFRDLTFGKSERLTPDSSRWLGISVGRRVQIPIQLRFGRGTFSGNFRRLFHSFTH